MRTRVGFSVGKLLCAGGEFNPKHSLPLRAHPLHQRLHHVPTLRLQRPRPLLLQHLHTVTGRAMGERHTNGFSFFKMNHLLAFTYYYVLRYLTDNLKENFGYVKHAFLFFEVR